MKSYGTNGEGNQMRTQWELVKEYLMKTGEKISHRDCEDYWGFMRLSAIMFEIKADLQDKNQPWVVKSEWVHGTSRFGFATQWKVYWMEYTGDAA